MIRRITWGSSNFKEDGGPFLRGKNERLLKITLHNQSLTSAQEKELEALNAIIELAYLPEIAAVETEGKTFPFLEVGIQSEQSNFIPVSVISPKKETKFSISNPNQFLEFAKSLIHQNKNGDNDIQKIYRDLILIEAHRRLNQDLFITLSPILLNNKSCSLLKNTNILTPLETIKVLGLFLRSRDNYTIKGGLYGKYIIDRGSFYRILMRHRLNNMWRYFSACVEADKMSTDKLIYLGQSILIRCARALEARDSIGCQFYVPQSGSTRDITMYHFDYLTLLLSGAIDAQARIAHRVYK
ncbi:unnamed protein product, partial [marine sediment metagenome]